MDYLMSVLVAAHFLVRSCSVVMQSTPTGFELVVLEAAFINAWCGLYQPMLIESRKFTLSAVLVLMMYAPGIVSRTLARAQANVLMRFD
jgi:hypothetical protein